MSSNACAGKTNNWACPSWHLLLHCVHKTWAVQDLWQLIDDSTKGEIANRGISLKVRAKDGMRVKERAAACLCRPRYGLSRNESTPLWGRMRSSRNTYAFATG